MRNWWRGFRNRKLDENKLRMQREAREKIKQLMDVGGHEAEGEFVEAYKKWRPDATREGLKEIIRQFHDAVNERKQRGLPRR
jgi:hypothetical protein